MAQIPDVQLSDRRLGVLGPIRALPARDVSTSWDVAGKAAGAGLRGLGDAFSAYFAVKGQQEARNADLAAAEFEEGWRRIHNGHVECGSDGSPVQVKGIRDYGEADYPPGENALTRLRDYEERFREGEAYRRLGREGRERFDLRVRSARQTAMEQANALFDRDARARIRRENEAAVRNFVSRPADLPLETDAKDFVAYADRQAANAVAVGMKPSVRAYDGDEGGDFDPGSAQFADEERFGDRGGSGSYRELFETRRRDASLKMCAARVDQILNAASDGTLTAEAAVALADEIVGRLDEEKRISQEQAAALRARVERTATLHVQGAANRLRVAEANGSLDEIEKSLGRLRSAAGMLREDTSARAAAETEVAKAEKSADALAEYEVMKTLAEAANDGRYSPGETSEYDLMSLPGVLGVTGERRLRVFEKARAGFDALQEKAKDRQTREERARLARNRDAEVLALRAGAFACMREGRPQDFYQGLVKAVSEKRITVRDFERLSAEFDNGWRKGLKDRPDELPKRTALANELYGIVSNAFGEDALRFTSSVQRDGRGNVALDKTGMFAFDPKKPPEDITFLREEKVSSALVSIIHPGSEHVDLRKNRLTAEQMASVLDKMLEISQCDGLVVHVDPVTGDPCEDPNGHRVNAVRDFAAWIERFRDRKSVLDGASMAAAMERYAGAVKAADAKVWEARRAYIAGSNPVLSLGGRVRPGAEEDEGGESDD